jgi:hypothetical protein
VTDPEPRKTSTTPNGMTYRPPGSARSLKAMRTPAAPAFSSAPPRRANEVRHERDEADARVLDQDATVTLTVRQWAALNQVLATLGSREIGLALGKHRIDRGLYDAAAARVHRVVREAAG